MSLSCFRDAGYVVITVSPAGVPVVVSKFLLSATNYKWFVSWGPNSKELEFRTESLCHEGTLAHATNISTLQIDPNSYNPVQCYVDSDIGDLVGILRPSLNEDWNPGRVYVNLYYWEDTMPGATVKEFPIIPGIPIDPSDLHAGVYLKREETFERYIPIAWPLNVNEDKTATGAWRLRTAATMRTERRRLRGRTTTLLSPLAQKTVLQPMQTSAPSSVVGT